MSTSYLDAIGEIVLQTMREIEEDIAESIVPPTVRTFSELHSHVDANMYADDLVTELEKSRDWAEFINDVTDRVDVWLRAGRPDDLDAQHTGSSWFESTPIYYGPHAETVVQFGLAMTKDFYGASELLLSLIYSFPRSDSNAG